MKRIFLLFIVTTAFSCNNDKQEKSLQNDNSTFDFNSLNRSLETSDINIQASIDYNISSFEATLLKNYPERSLPVYQRAIKVKRYVTELNDYIKGLKKALIDKAANSGVKDLAKTDTADVVHDMMISQGKAKELKGKIEDFRTNILSLLDAGDQDIKLALNTQAEDQHGQVVTWEDCNFGRGIPPDAAITNLIKIQLDLKNTALSVVNRILGVSDIPFTVGR